MFRVNYQYHSSTLLATLGCLLLMISWDADPKSFVMTQSSDVSGQPELIAMNLDKMLMKEMDQMKLQANQQDTSQDKSPEVVQQLKWKLMKTREKNKVSMKKKNKQTIKSDSFGKEDVRMRSMAGEINVPEASSKDMKDQQQQQQAGSFNQPPSEQPLDFILRPAGKNLTPPAQDSSNNDPFPFSRRPRPSLEHLRRILNDEFGILKESKFSSNNHLGEHGVPKAGSEDEY